MLTQLQRSVYLSLISTDLPVWSGIETVATLYQKDHERFHLLLTEPVVRDRVGTLTEEIPAPTATPRLLWLEFSPYRVNLTMQGNGQFSYRHLWERGVYGLSRYWLQTESLAQPTQFRLRNFTRNILFEGNPVPHLLRVEYELWSGAVQLGRYILNLEIRP